MQGLKSQDVVILLKLASLEDQVREGRVETSSVSGDTYSVRNLEAQLGVSKTEVNAALRRIQALGLAVRDRHDGHPRPNRRAVLEFITQGLKYVFPARPGAMTRGLPTAFAAPVLEGLLSGGDYIYVWPTPHGEVVGQEVAPLFRTVPEAAQRDARLYACLALVDAVRLGNPREAGFAGERLRERLLG